MDFKEKLKDYQQQINQELESYIRNQKCPEEVLNRAMEYSLMAGRKTFKTNIGNSNISII